MPPTHWLRGRMDPSHTFLLSNSAAFLHRAGAGAAGQVHGAVLGAGPSRVEEGVVVHTGAVPDTR